MANSQLRRRRDSTQLSATVADTRRQLSRVGVVGVNMA